MDSAPNSPDQGAGFTAQNARPIFIANGKPSEKND